MGRDKKVYATEVFERLEKKGKLTIEDLASFYKVCKKTIRNRLKELR